MLGAGRSKRASPDSSHKLSRASSTVSGRNRRTFQQPIDQAFAAASPIVDQTVSQPAGSTDAVRVKRIKRAHDSAEDIRLCEVEIAKRMDEADMYRFPRSRGPEKAYEIVDLTSDQEVECAPKRYPMKSNMIMNVGPKSASSGPRKLVIKNLRRPTGPDPNQYFQAVWGRLEATLTAVFLNRPLPHSQETLYNEVMILCRQKQEAILYDKLLDKILRELDQQIKIPLLDAANDMDGSDQNTLNRALVLWTSWSRQMDIVRAIFFYLDRSYLLREDKLPIIELGISLFRQTLMSQELTKTRISTALCEIANGIRRGLSENELVTRLRDGVEMFLKLNLYMTVLEPSILTSSRKIYEEWVSEAISTKSLDQYVRFCQDLIEDEISQSLQWRLDPTTLNALRQLLEEVAVEEQKDRLLNPSDVIDLLSLPDWRPAHRLYVLLKKRNLGPALRPMFEKHIIDYGSEIVFDEKREMEMVIRLMEFKSKLDTMCDQAFGKDVDFGHTLREAFETFINKSRRSQMTWGTDNPKPGEMIAKHVDMILKGLGRQNAANGLKDPDNRLAEANAAGFDASSEDEDEEITKQLDRVLDLFRFVHGKAVFEAFYKRDLARRLLLGRSASSAAEKSMLTRLRSECGAGFTHNLEQMFKDIEMAREEIASYRSLLENKREYKPSFDLSVNVLSSAAWPSYPQTFVNVPESILEATSRFEQYYKEKHSGRKLEWKHALAHCQIRARFAKNIKELVVSSFQAIVLLTFNSRETLTYQELRDYTGLDDVELKRTLQSLACARYRILSKHPKGRDIDDKDVFKINEAFDHEKFRIKINQIQAKETKQENQQTHERVAADRAFETQAAIVRIMKGRKTITHAELVSEVISATKSRGPLDPADIKKNIEKLIEKEFLERDDSANNTYNYLA